MSIIATAPVHVTNRLDLADTHRLDLAAFVAPAVLAQAADAMLCAGVDLVDAAAILGVSTAEVIELRVDHVCAVHGETGLVGMRSGADAGDGDR